MKENNWFVRLLIIALCILIGSGIFYRFIYIEPRGDLGPGVLIVLAMLIILVLSEIFNNFSLGSLLSMSKQVAEKNSQVLELKIENSELRAQVISIATTVSQRQTSTNIFGLPSDLARTYAITAAKEEEVQEKQADEQASIPEIGQPAQRRVLRRLDRKKIEQFGIDRFLKLNDLEQFPAVREVKLTSQIEAVDPVSTSSPVFDAYLTSLDAEIFIDVHLNSRYGSTIFLRDRLYVMLTKINHYRAIKKTNVFLSLILVTIPDEQPRLGNLSRLFNEFHPAISSGLLRIVELALTQQEADQVYEGDALE